MQYKMQLTEISEFAHIVNYTKNIMQAINFLNNFVKDV